MSTDFLPQFDLEHGDVGARFADIAACVPHHTAVIGARERASYGELLAWACNVAAALETRLPSGRLQVAVMCDPEPARIAAQLGVLLAGHTFVMLDASFPAAWSAQLLEDAQARVLLFDTANRPMAEACLALAPGTQPLVVSEVPERDRAWTPVRSTPDDLAAIIYTSGSTGSPKGVMRTHGMMLQRAWLETQIGETNIAERHAVLASAAFASANSDAFVSLLNGATLCLYDFARDGLNGLGAWLVAQKIEHFHPPVALVREWQLLTPTPLHGNVLRRIRLGGVHVTRRDFEILRGILPGAWKALMGYAASEMTTACRWHTDDIATLPEGVLPVGWPVPGKKVDAVGDDGHPVAPGELGEIVVSGRHLAPGYWRKPELTRERFTFLPDGTIRYRTGDRGWFDAQGALHLSGRLDNAVKIRGFRVVPGEIERVLVIHADIANAAVSVHRDEGHEPELVAHVVPAGRSPLTAAHVRAIVAAAMPAFCVPRHVILMDALPVLANGKLDRRRLPAPVREMPDDTVHPAEATTLDRVRRAWADVLQRRELADDVPFVSLGGDSFAAARLEVRLGELFGRPIQLVGLARHPTIARQARWIDSLQAGQADTPAHPGPIALNATRNGRLLYVMPGTFGTVDYAQPLAEALEAFTVVGLQPHFKAPGELLATDMLTLAGQLANDLCAHAQGRPALILGACVAGKLALEVAVAAQAQGQPVAQVLLSEPPGSGRELRSRWPGVRGVARWMSHALACLADEARHDGPMRPLQLAGATLALVKKRVTHPLRARGTELERRVRVQMRAISHAHMRGHYPVPAVLIRGAWSQLGFEYSGTSESLGWDAHIPNLTIRFVPGTHFAMFNPPFARSLARHVCHVTRELA